jgi:hypothetical protein
VQVALDVRLRGCANRPINVRVFAIMSVTPGVCVYVVLGVRLRGCANRPINVRVFASISVTPGVLRVRGAWGEAERLCSLSGDRACICQHVYDAWCAVCTWCLRLCNHLQPVETLYGLQLACHSPVKCLVCFAWYVLIIVMLTCWQYDLLVLQLATV